MSILPRRKHASNGQALVEFALIITVLLMLIFLIIESSRILWGWITVQNAAREGARYAVTGRYDGNQCAVANLPKFSDICDMNDSAKLRAASIISRTHTALGGLPLDEQSGIFEDDFYYDIQVYGADQFNQLREDFGGTPNNPVVVRAIYRVPIITPFFQGILPSIPVVGQVTMHNENFGTLGGSNQGQGLPSDVPPIPTAGVTPSPTFTPTPSDTPTPGATPTADRGTDTPTPTPTLDICGTSFTANPIAGRRFVLAEGEVDEDVTLINLTTGQTLDTAVFADIPDPDRECDGFTDFGSDLDPLVEGHVLMVESPNGTFDLAVVLAGTPTPTPTTTNTPAPTLTPSLTPSVTPSPTPSGPWIQVIPDCAAGPDVEFNVLGVNWPTNESINLFWYDGSTLDLRSTIPAGHSGSFSQVWRLSGLSEQQYEVRGYSNSLQNEDPPYKFDVFTVPCDVPPTPDVTTTPTPTPAPADLIVVGPPAMISTPPVTAYEPVDFRVTISNTGDIDVSDLFFVDLYFDPPPVVYTTTIPISYSVGFEAVSSLAGRTSRVISITAPIGFANEPPTHTVYSMVDSLQQINENIETNNISASTIVTGVLQGATPTPSPTPGAGANSIGGRVYIRLDNQTVPHQRALVNLIDEGTGQPTGLTTFSESDGSYEFNNVPDGTYSVTACAAIDGVEYFGIRTGIPVPPSQPLVSIVMIQGPCS